MLETMLRQSRVVRPDDKVCFDDTVQCRLLFANEPTVPATIPIGTKVRMNAPITLVGGEQRFLGKSWVVGEYNGKEFQLLGSIIAVDKIRGGANWFTVIEVP